MNLTRLPSLELRSDDTPRSSGMHLSGLQHALMKRVEPRRFDSSVSGRKANVVMFGLGNALERIIARELAALEYGWEKPGEFTVDTVRGPLHMSPDGARWEAAEGPRIDESKATWMRQEADQTRADGSVIYGIQHTKFAHYFVQHKGYCYGVAKALGAPPILGGWLAVCYINGTYRPPDPVVECYDVTYEVEELEANWAMLLGQWDRAEREEW